MQVHNTPALPLIAQPLPCPLCRSVLGARPTGPQCPAGSYNRPRQAVGGFLFFGSAFFPPPGASCLLVPMVFRTLRWPPFLPPFFGDSFCVGGFLCVLPILRTAVPPSLSSAKMSLARRQLNCCRRDSLRLASLPRTGFCLGWCPPPLFFLTGGDLHPPPRALLCQVPRRHQDLLHCQQPLPYDQEFLPGPAWPYRVALLCLDAAPWPNMPWRNRASYGQPIRYDAHPLLQATSKASPAAAQPAPEASQVNTTCPAQVPPSRTCSNSAPCEPRSHPYRRGAPISVHNLAKPICPHPPTTPLLLAKAIPCLPKGGLSVPSCSPRQPWGLPFSTPLPPPPPRPVPRSLLPKQCSGSVQPKTSWQTPAQQGTSLRTSAPFHRIASPRPRPPALTSGFTSSYSQQTNLRESLMEHWRSILAVFAEHSQLYCTCIASMHPMEILKTSLRRFAASTISQYLKILQTCLVFWQSMLWSPTALSLPQLADFLQVCQSSQEEDRPALKCSPKQAVKALSWLARTAQIADLATLLSNTLIRSFSLPCAPQERKEALPLPLATLVAWEQKLLQPDCPASLGLLLGGVLLAAHCSLRFKDLQRISFHSLSLSAHGTSTSTSWVVAWLRLLEQAWQATKTRYAGHHTRLLAAMPFATRYGPRPSLHRTNVVFSGPIFREMGAANPLVATRLRPGYTDRGIGFHAAQLENMRFERLCTAQIARGPPAGPPQAVLRSAVLQRRHN